MIGRFRRRTSATARLGLAVDDESAAVALVEREPNGLRLRHFAVAPEAGDDWAQRASSLTEALDVKGVPATTVMAEQGYQMVLVECPQVPADEVADAVRWKVRDLVAFPTDDAVIDTIDMPDQANQAHRPMVYAVAAKQQSVQRQVELADRAGLRLDAIDIPEMCLHNVALCLPHADAGVAFVHFADDYGTLVLSRAGVLYLIRRIDTGLAAIRSASADAMMLGNAVSGIALELQRSLDYFESHYDQRPIMNIVVGPGTPDGFTTRLGDELGAAVSALDLNEVLHARPPVPDELQPLMLTAVGAALRRPKAGAAA
ncbi:MAG: hypothetical protein AAGD86_08175 [Pseudomonadota bacterium]